MVPKPVRHLIVTVVTSCLVLLALTGPASAEPDGPVSTPLRFTASDGVSIAATLTSQDPAAARPTVVEFSPYGRGSGTLAAGPAYNHLLVQVRGTGDSDGSFDVLGPRSQQDVAEVLGWACRQSWSNGDLALNGFSASAIIVYNSLHRKLPCVKAAVLKSGTFELYRDLLVPGGIRNLLPGGVVLATIGAPALAQGADRLQRNPASSVDVIRGLLTSGVDAGLRHPTLDSFWEQRGFRGDVNHLPILMIDGFYDVESRGAFQAYQALRDQGDHPHLLVVGGHDGAPAGTDGGVAQARDWLDHYVRGVDNGAPDAPAVQMLLADGDREDMLAGDFVRRDADDWPVPGTTWTSLHLDPARSGSASSLNDSSLSPDASSRTARQRYLSVPSLPTSTDQPNTAVLGAEGLNQITTALPFLTTMNLAELIGLTYTTEPLGRDVLTAGPLDLDVRLASTNPEAAIWAVVSDVSPDGAAHPLTVGRLNTAFPGIDTSKSLYDAAGTLVQPYGDYSTKDRPGFNRSRLYHVELWPVGNRFKKGHRLRLELVGPSAASPLSLPGLNTVTVGGESGSTLEVPVLPGSDLAAALR